MNPALTRKQARRLLGWIMVLLLVSLSLGNVLSQSQPAGPNIISQTTETATPNAALNITTAGGTITTMVLNGTTQNPHWKAYVGNVTGRLVLQDGANYSIYNWQLTNPSGEVYASRNNTVNWTSIRCANSTQIATEETNMNHTASAVDSIANTFTDSTHQEFWTGGTQFTANECGFTTATYVNNTNQSELFQEIALYDGSSIVYATIIDPNTAGFDYGRYDFQLIVPEKGWEGPTSSTPYYFWVELV
ncbi:MAG: hypothetical protein GXP63_01725 [DPANN group archaeon]|nr:hypothetical protein [DPANN group archaeon]